MGTTIAKSRSGSGRDKRRKKMATPVFCKPKKIKNIKYYGTVVNNHCNIFCIFFTSI